MMSHAGDMPLFLLMAEEDKGPDGSCTAYVHTLLGDTDNDLKS